jgi:acetyl-CoA carboxylase/biotin carboxylase 1
VLSKHGGLAPLRIGFWRRAVPGQAPGYAPDPLLCAVEPPAARLLELPRLAAFGPGLTYAPSRNRQCHLYAVTQRRDARSLALKRVFVRGAVRQLGRPALLAATYKGDAGAIAAAAMEELEGTLVDALSQLERASPGPADKGEAAARPDWAHVYLSVLPALPLVGGPGEEGRIAAALRTACAAVMARHGAALRRAAVAQWEVRLRLPDASGAWRLVVSSPTGARSPPACSERASLVSSSYLSESWCKVNLPCPRN